MGNLGSGKGINKERNLEFITRALEKNINTLYKSFHLNGSLWDRMKKPNKTKILYIGPIPPEVGGQGYGGIATHLWELATHAHENGYDVYILANTTSSFTKDGIEVISLRENRLLAAFKGLKFWLTIDKTRVNFLNFLDFKEKLGILYRAYRLQQILESVKPDLIHVHSLHNGGNLALRILRPSIPVFITDHGAFGGIDEKKDLVRVSSALNIASYVICVSQYVKDRLEQLGLNYPKNTIIHNPININKFPLLNREELRDLRRDEKKIVFFSGVYMPLRKKRLDLLLRAFSTNTYLREKCKLVILTGKEGISYAKEFVSQKKIDALVLNPRPVSEIVRYYNIADVFVMPSILEAFGLTYIEALSVGTPVVGFHGTLKEIECLLGVYIGEKFDPSHEGEEKLAQKIVKVLNTDFDRKLLRRKVIENLSWDAKFNEFDSIYREVLLYANKSRRF